MSIGRLCIFIEILDSLGTTNFPKAVLSTQRAFITNLFTSSLHKRRAIVRKGEDVPLPSPDDLQVGLLLPIP